jgi:hypothetical protein
MSADVNAKRGEGGRRGAARRGKGRGRGARGEEKKSDKNKTTYVTKSMFVDRVSNQDLMSARNSGQIPSPNHVRSRADVPRRTDTRHP